MSAERESSGAERESSGAERESSGAERESSGTIAQAVSCIDGYDPEALRVDKANAAIRACLTPVAGATTRKRTPGAWAHLGKLGDPDLFLRPDPELGADADGPIFPTPIFPTSGGFHEP